MFKICLKRFFFLESVHNNENSQMQIKSFLFLEIMFLSATNTFQLIKGAIGKNV